MGRGIPETTFERIHSWSFHGRNVGQHGADCLGGRKTSGPFPRPSSIFLSRYSCDIDTRSCLQRMLTLLHIVKDQCRPPASFPGPGGVWKRKLPSQRTSPRPEGAPFEPRRVATFLGADRTRGVQEEPLYLTPLPAGRLTIRYGFQMPGSAQPRGFICFLLRIEHVCRPIEFLKCQTLAVTIMP